MMSTKFCMLASLFATFTVLAILQQSEARYLPTRGAGDRIDKLRELLKEVSRVNARVRKLLENEIEKEEYQADAPPRWHPENKLFYKREIPSSH